MLRLNDGSVLKRIQSTAVILIFPLFIYMVLKLFSSAGMAHELSTEELYVLSTHWLSDIVFCEQEINYFQSLIVRYFLPNVEEEYLIIIEGLQNQLVKLDGAKNQLRDNILAHQNLLSKLFDHTDPDSDAYFNAQTSNLEGLVTEFMKNLKQVKLEFFNATKFSGKAKIRIP